MLWCWILILSPSSDKKEDRSKTCFKSAVNNWFANLNTVSLETEEGGLKGSAKKRVFLMLAPSFNNLYYSLHIHMLFIGNQLHL